MELLLVWLAECKSTSAIDCNIIINAKKNRYVSAAKLALKVQENHNITVTPQTIRNRIRDQGYRGRVVRKKPFLTAKQMKRRLEFAKKYEKMPISYWNKFFWSDESKYNLVSSDRVQNVCRKKEEAYKLSCLRGSVKHGGGNVMLWGSMSWKGVGKLTFIDEKMDASMYCEILKANLRPSTKKLRTGNDFILQQDNDPKHTAKKMKVYFDTNNINVLEWPSQSPDLNPIENLWYILDRKIGDRAFRCKDNLKEAIMSPCDNITTKETQNLVNSMPNRLAETIKAKRGPP